MQEMCSSLGKLIIIFIVSTFSVAFVKANWTESKVSVTICFNKTLPLASFSKNLLKIKYYKRKFYKWKEEQLEIIIKLLIITGNNSFFRETGIREKGKKANCWTGQVDEM